MRSVIALAMGIGFLFVLFSTSRARTWEVRQDGSGDFVAIQPAIEAAAPGDTVSVGSGRFEELTEATIEGWDGPETIRAHVVVTVDSLTVVGSGRNLTIIGATEPPDYGNPTDGIAVPADLTYVRLTDLCVVKQHRGLMLAAARCELADCRVDTCHSGAYVHTAEGLLVERCAFQGNIGLGLYASELARNVEIRECEFTDSDQMLMFSGTVGVEVRNCTFRGGATSIDHGWSSSGAVIGCTFTDFEYYGIQCSHDSVLEVRHCRASGGRSGLRALYNGYVTGSHNVFEESRLASVFCSGGDMELHECQILKGDGYCFEFGPTVTGPPQYEVNLTNNYWGTTNTDSLAAWIFDSNDDDHSRGTAVYEPFLSDFTPSRRTTAGGVRKLFR